MSLCVSLSNNAEFCSTVYRPGETHSRSLTSTVLHVAVNGSVLSALPCTVCTAILWHGIGARAVTCLVHFAAPTQKGTLAGSLPVLPVRPSSVNCKENEDCWIGGHVIGCKIPVYAEAPSTCASTGRFAIVLVTPGFVNYDWWTDDHIKKWKFSSFDYQFTRLRTTLST